MTHPPTYNRTPLLQAAVIWTAILATGLFLRSCLG